MKLLILAALLPALSLQPEGLGDVIDSTVICASRAADDTPVAHVTLYSDVLKASCPSVSLPMSLGGQVSVISTCEGGTGLGYSNIRIRGVSNSQTNVTLNGITLNDAESQEVFWVNLPAIASMLSSVQIQRGLGTSACGPGAFGASINMVSASRLSSPPFRAETGFGSFGTFTATAQGGSRALPGGFHANAAASLQRTDGYMENAFARVLSWLASAGWAGARDAVDLTFIGGMQHTGITWNGVPMEIYPVNRRYNPSVGDSDNYRQTHLQLRYTHDFGGGFDLSSTANWTKGYGFYEVDGVRDVLDNDLFVLRNDLRYTAGKVRADAGVYLSSYGCLHSGVGYEDDALKREADIWARAEWKPVGTLTVYGDVQYRAVMHRMLGMDLSWDFLNPRLGFSLRTGRNGRMFLSLAGGHREPARTDIQSSQGVRPESMLDLEAGFSMTTAKFDASATLYSMTYRDMLVESGYLDEAGYPIKVNEDKGRRRGIEAEVAWKPLESIVLKANCTLSDNRISDGRPILLSPSLMGNAGLTVKLWKGSTLEATWQYVGRQYWDNSGDEDHLVPAYDVLDLKLSQEFRIGTGLMRLSAYAFNLLDREYFSYACAWGVYPQPPVNAMLKLEFVL